MRRADGAAPPHLTPTEWAIVEALVRHPGRLVTQRQLLQTVWGPQYERETNYLRVHLAAIRKKLEPEPRGRGTSSPSRASATGSSRTSPTDRRQRRVTGRPIAGVPSRSSHLWPTSGTGDVAMAIASSTLWACWASIRCELRTKPARTARSIHSKIGAQ